MRKCFFFIGFTLLVILGLFFSSCIENKNELTPDNSSPLINKFDLFPIQIIRYNTTTILVKYNDYDGDNVEMAIVPDYEKNDTAIPTVYNSPDEYIPEPGDPVYDEYIKDPTHHKAYHWFASSANGRYWFKATATDGNFTTESVFSIIVLSRPPDIYWESEPFNSWTINPTVNQQFEISVTDVDEPPTTTVTAKLLLIEDFPDTYPDGQIWFDKATGNADAITIDDSYTATITINDPSKIYSIIGYYNASAEDSAATPIDYYNTYTLKILVSDECNNENTILKQITISK
jgi:hypothetical protein